MNLRYISMPCLCSVHFGLKFSSEMALANDARLGGTIFHSPCWNPVSQLEQKAAFFRGLRDPTQLRRRQFPDGHIKFPDERRRRTVWVRSLATCPRCRADIFIWKTQQRQHNLYHVQLANKDVTYCTNSFCVTNASFAVLTFWRWSFQHHSSEIFRRTLRTPYGMSRPSVVCLSSVCNVVAFYLQGWTLGHYFLKFWKKFKGVLGDRARGYEKWAFFDQTLALFRKR